MIANSKVVMLHRMQDTRQDLQVNHSRLVSQDLDHTAVKGLAF